MEGILELNEFFVEGHDHEKSHVILHITDPSPTDVHKGHFIGLAEIRNGSRDEIIELEKIFDDLEKTYYNTQNTPDKNSLELSLEFINRRAQEVLGESEAEIDCFVGVLENFHLIFSTHGTPLGYLFYTKNGTVDHLSIIEEEKHPKHFFSSLTEGDLHQGDSLLLATPQTGEFFAPDRLEKLILTRSTEESVEHLHKVLKQLRSGNSYGGVLLHSVHKTVAAKIEKKSKETDRGSVASIHSLVQKEKDTATTLAPPIFHETREKMKAFFDEKKEEFIPEEESEPVHQAASEAHPKHPTHTKNTPAQPRESLDEKTRGDIILSIGKILVAGIHGILLFFVTIFRFFQTFFVSIFYLITNRHDQRRHILNSIHHSVRAKIDFLKHLPLISKILFSLALISLLGFVASAVYLRVHAQQAAQNQNYTNLLTAIDEKKNAAEASLLYNDTDRALTLVQEATNFIDQLPHETPEEQQKITDLKNSLSDTMSKLQRMTVVNAEMIADLSAKNPMAKGEHMIKLDNSLIIDGPQDPSLSFVSLDTKEVTTQLHDTLPSFGASTAPKEQDKVVFISSDKNIAEFTKTTKALSSADITFPVENVKLISIGLYNRRLYALDGANNQIFKHSQTLSGYDKGTAWITDPAADITNAVSFAIDGDMYVLKANGSVVKLSSGKLAPFTASGILPALTAPTRIWTSSDSNFLYILEPAAKRIIVLTKEGKFEKQFTSTAWTSPNAFVVDEKGKKIYVLDTTKVWSFGM